MYYLFRPVDGHCCVASNEDSTRVFTGAAAHARQSGTARQDD